RRDRHRARAQSPDPLRRNRRKSGRPAALRSREVHPVDLRAMNAAYVREALELARQGRGQTSPNPLVGAVLVHGGEVVGRGFHTWAGVKHAEILALEQAGAKARGATLYINLEPCSHQGRTGPCAQALIEAGIGEVVAAMQDPN